MVAFLGRYGRQDASVTLNMPLRDLGMLATEVADLVREENDSFRQEDR